MTLDKFHVVAQASKSLDTVRRQQQKADPELKLNGLRWALLKDPHKLNLAHLTDLLALVKQCTNKRTTRAWLYREQLREILERKQIHVVSERLRQWCTNIMRSKVEPMKEVARMWQTNSAETPAVHASSIFSTPKASILRARFVFFGMAMEIQKTESVRGVHALHLVDADLDHLERAIEQPENRMLNAQYWRRRVQSDRHQFELTREQRARVEAILERLAQRSWEPEPTL